MQRSKIRSSLTAGGLFDASLEGFAKVRDTKIARKYHSRNCYKKKNIYYSS